MSECEGSHTYGTGDVDADPRKVQSCDINTFYEQCRQIGKYFVAPATESSTDLVDEATSFNHANVDPLNKIILNRLHLWKRAAEEIGRETIITNIARSGLTSTADRLSYLNKLVEEDPEEQFMGVESLRRFADFAMRKHLPAPKIGLNPDGSVHAVWWADDHDGILAMDFLSSGEISYAAILQDSGWSVSGVSSPGLMMEEIEPFKRVLD